MRSSLGNISTRKLLDQNLHVLLVIIAPVLILMVIDPDSFVAGWNEGRGGLVFALFFGAVEWYDLRSTHSVVSRKTLYIWAIGAGLLSAFYLGIFSLGLRELLVSGGRLLGLPEMPKMFSWIAMCEYGIFGIYIMMVLASSYGLRNFKMYVTPVAYLFGMAVIFFLDAAFPYDQLGPLQAIVLFLVPPVAWLLNIFGITTRWRESPARLYVYCSDNASLIPRGALDFFWPCVGVQSMIIFGLIIVVLVAKLDAPNYRKIIYALTGAVGTVAINILRIFAISYTLAIYGIEKAKAFHESFGEILFLVWIVVFLVVAVKIEDRISVTPIRSDQATGEPPSTTVPRQ